jgi:hypothetical protein
VAEMRRCKINDIEDRGLESRKDENDRNGRI